MDKIKSYKVSLSITYDPDIYLGYCKDDNNKPTQDDFLDFIQDWINNDFGFGASFVKIEMIE